MSTRSDLDRIRAPEPVLATMRPDGSRIWVRPRVSPGRFLRARRAVAYGLILIFLLIPFLRMNGRPLVLLDLPRREFTLFGTTFLPTEMTLFMLLFISVLIGIFLVTALAGRAWCGWACPQTVYMEFLFRPIERWIEGGSRGSRKLDRQGRHFHPRRLLKHAVYLGLALILAHAFLAYFVPIGELTQWVTGSPLRHWTSFMVVAFTTGLVFFDFAYFREQTCLVACPYGRLQSVLLDRRSLIVGYDPRRGEPRGRGVKERPPGLGDCIDCQLCVLTCPTGIDIRAGLQMECIHCAQCVDACDAVMERIGKPRGLIRYSSVEGLGGVAGRWLRPRVIAYPLAFAVTFGLFLVGLSHRTQEQVTLLRGPGEPYTLAADGRVVNQIRIRITNPDDRERHFRIWLHDAPEAQVILPFNPVAVGASRTQTVSMFVILSREGFEHGQREATIRIQNPRGVVTSHPYRLAGPEREADPHPGDGKEAGS